ncbi:hypothetical protein ACRS6Y_03610 [Bacillus cytotoxicus]|uniref:Group-specific protein n=2 Tax=Bacillus cytotoxicus TaxID=580165 RepID=A7GVA5_BACCN|nr:MULTISPECIES: hypothetical protein [Bacillus cereus group]ABS24063.1 conserved hypothetical protein [Bacillus cytotoxicus NVH 391-98]AWC34693.1 hypothetical protein CG482_021435 [Bacillus cytotoxicus]AWC38686.1 hypothetical protein CG481_021270 [Bacillus cytotoxicus]AWC46662.1 hypothetical protein CG479_020575 [Bacillus cytotoxicus]AWC62905.1 hypothetical protein CG474_020995 [Bacillus cytotoxicus]
MKNMIIAGALTLAGITGATAFISETKVAAATQEQSFTKFYSLQPGTSSEKEAIFLKKGQELTIHPNSKTPSYSVYDANHNLIGHYFDGYSRIFTAQTDGNMYVQYHAPSTYYSPISFSVTYTIQ